MKTNTILILSLVIFSLISGCCCRKNKCEDPKDIDTQSASDFEQGASASDDISDMADAVSTGNVSFKTSLPDDVMAGCATVTRDTDTVTGVIAITIDFGTSNCLCIDNRYRRGIINIVRYGVDTVAGSYRTVSFSNYFVGKTTDKMYQVEGTHTITANGKNSNNNWNWTITGQNMKITGPNGKFHSWNSTRNREMIAGYDTPTRTDNVFLINGNASGTNINGNTYTANIIASLRREGSCHWIVKGLVEIVPSNKPQRLLDFGTGSCDNEASVTINGNTYTIELH